MPRRRIRENDIRRLLREHLKLELPSILVESSLDLRSSKEEWLHTKRLKCKPDVLLTPLPSQCSTGLSSTEAIIRDAGLILLNATFNEVEEFIDRHIGKPHTINGIKGVLSHFVVEPYIPHRPDEEFDLMIHSRRLVNVITFGPHSSPRKSFIEVPIESDVTAAPISEVLLYPFLSGPSGGYTSASICKLASLICLIYKFFDDLSFTSLEFSPLAILKSSATVLPQSVLSSMISSHTKSPKDKAHEDMASSVPFTLRFAPPPSSPPPPPPPNPPATSPLNGSDDGCGGYSVPITRPNRSFSVAAKMPTNRNFYNAENVRANRSKSISTRVPLIDTIVDEDVDDIDESDDDTSAKTQQKSNEKTRVESLIIPLDISGEADYNAMYYKSDKWFSGNTNSDDFFPVLWGSQEHEEEDVVDSMSRPCSNATLRLTVVNPEARIWFIGAGAGAAMIIADTLVHRGYGHELGNFCEYTGAITEDQTYRLCKIVINLAMKSGRSGMVILLVGCIANYTDVSITNKGFVRAIREEKERLCDRQVRIIVRRPGPNYHSALHEMRKCSRDTGVDIRAFGPEVTLTSTVGMAISYIEAFDKNPPKPPPVHAVPKSPIQNQLRQPHSITPLQQAACDPDKPIPKTFGNSTANLPTQNVSANVNLPTGTIFDTSNQTGIAASPAQSIFPLPQQQPTGGSGNNGSNTNSGNNNLSAAVPVPQPLFGTAGIFGSSPQGGASSLFTPIPSHIHQNHKKQQQQQQINILKDSTSIFSKSNTNDFSFGVVTPRQRDSPVQHSTQQTVPQQQQQQESSQLAKSPLLPLTFSSLQRQQQYHQINTTKESQVFPPKTSTNDFSFGVVTPRQKDSPVQHSTQQTVPQQQEPSQLAKSPLPPLSISSFQIRQQQEQQIASSVPQLFKSPSNSPSFKPATPFQTMRTGGTTTTQKISFMNDTQFGAPLFTKSPIITAGDFGAASTAAATNTSLFGDAHVKKNPPLGSLQAQIAAAGIGPIPSDGFKALTGMKVTTPIAVVQPAYVNPPSMNLNGSNSGSASRSTSTGPQDKKII